MVCELKERKKPKLLVQDGLHYAKRWVVFFANMQCTLGGFVEKIQKILSPLGKFGGHNPPSLLSIWHPQKCNTGVQAG